jgi:hypothetical protein
MLGRQVDFGRIEADSAGKYPMLLIGAVDVLSGQFRTFNSRRDQITAATVLALQGQLGGSQVRTAVVRAAMPVARVGWSTGA